VRQVVATSTAVSVLFQANGALFVATATPIIGPAVKATGATTPILINGLQANTAYTITVTNVAQATTSTPPVPVITLAAPVVTAPAAPVINTVIVTSNAAIVAFTAVTNAVPDASFQALATPNVPTAAAVPVAADGTHSPITIPGLQPNVKYTFTVISISTANVPSGPSAPAQIPFSGPLDSGDPNASPTVASTLPAEAVSTPTTATTPAGTLTTTPTAAAAATKAGSPNSASPLAQLSAVAAATVGALTLYLL